MQSQGRENKKDRRAICFLAIAFCLCTLPAMADTLFSDLGPVGNPYDCCNGATITGSGFPGGYSDMGASAFTVGGSGSLLSLRLIWEWAILDRFTPSPPASGPTSVVFQEARWPAPLGLPDHEHEFRAVSAQLHQ